MGKDFKNSVKTSGDERSKIIDRLELDNTKLNSCLYVITKIIEDYREEINVNNKLDYGFLHSDPIVSLVNMVSLNEFSYNLLRDITYFYMDTILHSMNRIPEFVLINDSVRDVLFMKVKYLEHMIDRRPSSIQELILDILRGNIKNDLPIAKEESDITMKFPNVDKLHNYTQRELLYYWCELNNISYTEDNINNIEIYNTVPDGNIKNKWFNIMFMNGYIPVVNNTNIEIKINVTDTTVIPFNTSIYTEDIKLLKLLNITNIKFYSLIKYQHSGHIKDITIGNIPCKEMVSNTNEVWEANKNNEVISCNDLCFADGRWFRYEHLLTIEKNK